MEFPHNFMRPPPPQPQPQPQPQPPPPPAAADPYQRPPLNPQPAPWSGQFQHNPQSQTYSPPPPYAATPPPPPYPAHYPPAPPHQLPPRPPPHQPHYSQSYHQPQEWGSNGWNHNQNQDYATNNTEDWAAKARAWAAAKAASENQHRQPQFVQAGTPEEPNHYHDQYSKGNTPFSDDHTHRAQPPNYHHYPVGTGSSNGGSLGQLPPGQSSYTAGMPVPYVAEDGSLAGNSVGTFHQPEKSSLNQFVYQLEVPSSYSSVPGNEGADNRYDKFNNTSPHPVAPLQHHVHPLPPAAGNHSAESMSDLSNQQLNFTPQFNGDLDPHVQSNYPYSSGGPLRSPAPVISPNHAWAPHSTAGNAYPSGPFLTPSMPPEDQQIPLNPHTSAHAGSTFPTGPGFQPSIPIVGSAFGVGTGVTPHPTSLPSNGYGVVGFPERPKKAAVPNWLREEIIKNKAVSNNTGPVILKEDTRSAEEDSLDRSYGREHQADSKSTDSSKSTEDEDEDVVEAARTAAVNLEIKRVLTEVLLKVTDELFDEIATKVLKEDDSLASADHDDESSKQNPSPSTGLMPKAIAKMLITTKPIKGNHEDSSDNSASGSPGDLLGLANYASDEEDGEMLSPDLPNQNESSTSQKSSSRKLLEGNPIVENGDFHEHVNHSTILEVNGFHNNGPLIHSPEPNPTDNGLNNNVKASELTPRDSPESVDSRMLMSDDPDLQITGDKSHKNNSYENKIGSLGEDRKDSESGIEKIKNADEEHTMHEERRARSERTDPLDDSRGKGKAEGKSGESIKDSNSRKRSPDGKERASDTGRERNSRNDERRSRDEKRERSSHKSEHESSRHKRRRSSSVGVRNRKSKDNLVAESSDESSDDSKRKSHRSRRHRSPSPIRRRDRSPHSKRRHSPYSSLENTRRRRSPSRSRSRSPVRRRR